MTGSIDGLGQATAAGDVLNVSGRANEVVNLGTSATTNIASFTDIETFVGNATNNQLVGGVSWAITTPNSGTVDGKTFTNFSILKGTTGDDSFALSGTGTVTGSIDGLGQATADTLTARDVPNTWSINAPNAGSVTNVTAFTGIENLTGGTNTDAFTLSGTGSVSGTITGGGAVLGNTLQARDVANTWNLTANDAGNVTNVYAFTGIGNLVGGNTTDNFVFSNAVVMSGTVNGGTGAGANTLDWSAYATPRSVALTSAGTPGFNGNETSITGGFLNITAVTGPAGQANTLQGMAAPAAWAITTLNSGTYTSGQVLTFTNFPNLTGNGAADTFTLAGGTLSGAINGGGGGDTLAGSTTYVVTGPDSGTATGVGGGFTNIANLVGTAGNDTFTLSGVGTLSGSINGVAGNDTLTGANVANTWTIGAAQNSGTLTGVAGGWSNIANLVGGTSTDTYTGAGGNLTGTITDSSGISTLNGAITTAGAQTYTGAVTLGSATTVTGVGNTFSSTVTGAQTLSIVDSGTTTFGGAVSVASLTTDAGGTTAINGGSVTTTGAQSYGDAVTLGAATTLTGVGNTF
ncbi:MAG: hypothetical protein AABM33_05660, partial [Pseudomonadota bacterium]